jgi:hypothetical protein
MLLLTLQKARFYTIILLLEDYSKYCLDPELEPQPQPKLSEVGTGTGTATNHYGSKQKCTEKP